MKDAGQKGVSGVYIPKLNKGMLVVGNEIIINIQSHNSVFVTEREHPGWQNKNQEFAELKQLAEGYYENLVYYEDPEYVKKFEMAAVMDEV